MEKNKKADGGVFTSQITVILITNINKNDIHYFFSVFPIVLLICTFSY